MNKEEMLDMEAGFYDPHPGFGGAIMPLPRPMLRAASELDGKRMTLRGALEILRPAAEQVNGSVDVVFSHKYIKFEYSSGRFTHNYRLIRFEYPTLW